MGEFPFTHGQSLWNSALRVIRWTPCKRRDFITKLKKLGFESPEPGGRHFYMRHETFTLTLPNNAEYSIPQIKMLLKEIELGIKMKISLEVRQKL